MKKALKYTFWTLGIIILLFFILFMALSILIQKPKFQTWAVQKSSALLSEKFGSKVSVGSVDIKFIKNIELNKIYLEDKNKDTLLYANKINAEFLLGENFIEQVKNLKNKKNICRRCCFRWNCILWL
jgi:translocation and assembly module TamB